ncbi:MAG: FtsW/RodA/SpoVE family cell cycle protein [Ruminococcus sp.]|uniref:FtsW/RodA/SpoVE family cell cycle protein n=1 Tax=Ruminococcus sp. TaxID=41978 RepID=UPI002873DF55|nr:FtsW/RodA/SpoVE family cell cycle protein [Ruminococcus sp.]MBQ3284071.1 FtsW/RodA/SpoVE family cell cycle protein [Ruminococcus sp.]
MQKIIKGLTKFFTKSDVILWLLTIAASVYSILLIKSMQRSSDYSYITPQLLALVVGYIAAIVITLIDYERIARLWPLLAAVSLGLLLLVFVIGRNVSGTDDTAWITLPGGVSFQPSELVKIFFIITFAKHLQMLKDSEMLRSLIGVISLLIHMAIPVVLIHMQGDDGTVLIFIFMFIIMAFIGGVQLRYFLIMILLLAAGIPIFWTYFLNEEQKSRFTAVFDIDGNALKTYGWQQYQGKVSVASGGLSGTGLGNGPRVASGIVPEQENDFIYTVAGEELGFIGCVLLLFILLLICIKIMMDAKSARDYLGRMICIGVFSMISVQTIINIGMVLGLLPVIGITLPFFSSGGSSLMSVLIGIGLVQSVHYHKDTVESPHGKLTKNRYKYLNSMQY